MSGKPYINLFVGDEIKATRRLSLEEKGARMELIFEMHESGERGILIGHLIEFSRTMGANSALHAKQILSKLQAKEAFEVDVLTPNLDPELEVVKITYPPMVKKFAISQIRSEAGSKGGEQSGKKRGSKTEPNGLPKTNQNAGIGIGNGIDPAEKDRGTGEENTGGTWNTYPGKDQADLQLTLEEIENSAEYISLTQKATLSKQMIQNLWKAFVIQKFDGHQYYQTRAKAISHFRNWLKMNHGNSNSASATPKSGNGAGIQGFQALKREAEQETGDSANSTGTRSHVEPDNWLPAEAIDA